MNIYIKYDVSLLCKTILNEQLEKTTKNFVIVNPNEIDFKKDLTNAEMNTIKDALSVYGIEIIDNQKSVLIQKIKDIIVELVWSDATPNVTTSVYIAEKLNHSYGYLSSLFSEITFTSIENYIIIQKIERAKQLLASESVTLTEISYLLNYSSVAHLSNQFKKMTGITPSAFQRIIKKRREKRINT
ncbi:MAG: helix-turn-helix transcriptional regulator [Chitinophagales bacterium]|nr:helix-turn-helix transcriptional regulator [Chitinophagales bacterium]